MMKRPTQIDVARLAGVSRGTVSIIINGQTDGRVPISEETRKRVLAAIEELGYEPDARARALRSGDTKTIGYILIDMYNPHFWENADGIEKEARVQGYNILLYPRTLDPEYIKRVFTDLTGRRIDGLVLSGDLFYESVEARKALNLIHRYRLPIAEICDRYPDYELDCLVSDYRSATVDVVNYLLSLGHRKIGMVYGVVAKRMAVDRLEPYLECLKKAGLPANEDLVAHCGPTLEDGYQAALSLLKRPPRPTAIIAINDLLAFGVMRAARDLNLHIPTDLSLVGYDDIPMASYMTPRLTTASKEIEIIGRDVVRLVLERIKNPERPYQVIYKPAHLIIRESTGLAPS
jgi:LacI family transcriptional regulator